MKKIRWKKIIYYIITISLFILLVLFILFSALIANPFESSYHKNLLHLLPREANSIAYIPDLRQLRNSLEKSFPGKELLQTKFFQQISAIREYRQFQRDWRKLKKQEKQIGFEFLKEKYLWKLLQGEVACATRIKEKELLFVSVVRIGFLLRIAEGIFPYVVSGNIKNIDFSQVIKKIKLDAKHSIFLHFEQDLLFISNNKDFLQESTRLLHGSNQSILLDSTILKNHKLKNENMLFFLKNDFIKYIPEKIKQDMYPIIDVATLTDTIISIDFFPFISIKGITQLDSSGLSEYHQDIYQLQNQPFPVNILPHNVYLLTQAPINLSMWNHLYNKMPRKLKLELDKRIKWLNHNYKTDDFIKERVFDFLEGQVALAVMPIDYVKENIEISDPYPAVAICLRTNRPTEFYESILHVMRKEIAKTKGKVKVIEKKYGSQKFYFLDVGGFDFTGGAIQPALWVIDNYIILTSNHSFLRNMIDVQDNIAQTWKKSSLYNAHEEATILSGPIQLAFSGEGIILYFTDFKESWAEEMALSLFNRNPRGLKMEQIQARILRKWQKYLDSANSFDVKIILEIQPSLDEIEWNISSFVNILY